MTLSANDDQPRSLNNNKCLSKTTFGLHLGVHQIFSFEFDPLVFFPFLSDTFIHWGLGILLFLPLVRWARSVLGVHQWFPFDLDPLV